jgi:aldehyde:ferredoxin oxidoreductase
VTLYGYAGQILWVDLSLRTTRITDLDPQFARTYVGGKGFGAGILTSDLAPGVDPLSPENIVVISTGPFTGSTAFSPKSNFVTKSPLTGGWLDCTLGGHFGRELKKAGFDIIVVRGAADGPVYLLIEDDRVEIRDASDLWGKGSHETEKTLREKAHTERHRVVSIGPAGENLVRFACVNGDYYRQAGRGGIGAVFGSKRLKAVAVRGTQDIAYAEPEAFKRHTRELNDFVKENGEPFATDGTMFLVDDVDSHGMLPTHNFQRTQFAPHESINAETMKSTIKRRDAACYGCVMHCGNHCEVDDPIYGHFEVEGPEYETAALLGANCGVDNLNAIAWLNLLCDDLGMDSMSAGGTIAFALECRQRGLVTPEQVGVDGFEWGGHAAIAEMLKMIAAREGFGDVLAEGSRRAAAAIGGGAERYVMGVKGMEMPAYDPRGALAMGVNYAVADRGACHLRAFTLVEEMWGFADPYATAGKSELLVARMRKKTVLDSLGTCELIGLEEVMNQLLHDATGWHVGSHYSAHEAAYPDMLDDLLVDDSGIGFGERLVTLIRWFNTREGVSRNDDVLPARFYEDPAETGPHAGRTVDREAFEEVRRRYYELCGWDERGIPTQERLESLDLNVPEPATIS